VRLLAEQSVSIRRDVTKVFAYVSNMENFSQWFPAVRSIVAANPQQPIEPGKEYLEVVATPTGEEREIRLRVKEMEPYRLFATEGDYPPLMPRMEIQLQADSTNGCIVTWRMLSRNEEPESALPWLALARQAIDERAKAGLGQLRTRLET
jgi:uncharacterized protein YndB with AHSA1/START domain